MGRSPHGERGLKFPDSEGDVELHGRSPHGERGLKFLHFGGLSLWPLVAPRTGSVG